MRNKGVVAGGTEPLRLFAANNIKLRLPLFVMYTTPIFIFDTRQSVDFFPTIYRRSIRLPSLESQQPPTSFNRTNPTMDRPRSSGYGNPLTFNVAVMFLFYILSVTLCLSSFSTCVCVIFSPIGTFRAIANYLFYALGLTVLSNFLLAALFGVYFDNPTSPESQRMHQIKGETLIREEVREEVQEEVAAPQQADDAAPAEEAHHEVSTTREGVETTPIRKGHRQGSATQEVVQTMPTQEAYPEVSAAQEVGKATLSATAPQQTALEDVSEKLFVDTAKTADGTPRSCEETPAPPERMSDAAEQEKNAPEANATDHTETAGFEKATANVITPRESKKIEKWISQTNSADTRKGDDADDLTEETTETMAVRRNDGGSPSETRSVSQDSDFQSALRVYMGKGPRGGGRQGRSSDATPSSESSEGSEFQRSVRRGVRAGEGWGERGWGEGWESA